MFTVALAVLPADRGHPPPSVPAGKGATAPTRRQALERPAPTLPDSTFRIVRKRTSTIPAPGVSAEVAVVTLSLLPEVESRIVTATGARAAPVAVAALER